MYDAQINNLSPLPFYQFEGDGSWDSQKWYANGNVHPIITDSDFPSFFIRTPEDVDFLRIRVFKLCNQSGIAISQSDFVEVFPEGATSSDVWYTDMFIKGGLRGDIARRYLFYLPGGYSFLSDGFYYMQIVFADRALTSDIFRVNTRTPDEDELQIVWKNNEDTQCGASVIPYSLGYKNTLFVRGTIAKPEYDYEEEGEERMGFFYPTKQVSYKKYKFSFLAPEYLCDVVRLIPLSDYISIVDNRGNYLVPTRFDVDFTWIEGGQLANVECEFTTDTVVKRIGVGVSAKGGDFNKDFNNDFNVKQ